VRLSQQALLPARINRGPIRPREVIPAAWIRGIFALPALASSCSRSLSGVQRLGAKQSLNVQRQRSTSNAELRALKMLSRNDGLCCAVSFAICSLC